MMKAIVIFNSKTGFTKRYADWISEELNCETLPYCDLKKTTISDGEVVIYGSRIHAGTIEHLGKVKSHFSNHRNLIVFATGGTPATETETIEKVWKSNFASDEIDNIPHFYFQSGMNYEKMGFADRTIMKIVAMFLDRKKDKSETEKGFEQAIRKSYDNSSKEYIAPLLEFVRGN